MLKISGSALILLGSLGLAFSLKYEVVRHLKLLYAMRNLLVTLSSNMRYRMIPMELLLKEEREMEDERLQKICLEIGNMLAERQGEKATEIWKHIFQLHRKELHLSTKEQELIEDAGKAFFGKEVEENEKYLQLYLEQLDFIIEEERKKQGEKEKVIQTVTVMSGLLVILLLI